jgi:hypothetical protein
MKLIAEAALAVDLLIAIFVRVQCKLCVAGLAFEASFVPVLSSENC